MSQETITRLARHTQNGFPQKQATCSGLAVRMARSEILRYDEDTPSQANALTWTKFRFALHGIVRILTNHTDSLPG